MSSLTYSHRNREPARAQVKNNEPEGGGGTATLRMDKKKNPGERAWENRRDA